MSFLGITDISLLDVATFLLLGTSLFMALFAVFRGPTDIDRIVALDITAAIFSGLTVVFVLLTGDGQYLDAAIVLSLTSFLGTVALAEYYERHSGQ